MAELGALLSQGLPPTGVGVFLRDRVAEVALYGARFGIVNAERGDALEQIRELGEAWIYTMPNDWEPGTWESVGLPRLLRLREAAMAAGVTVLGLVVNPEWGWPDLSGAERTREATKFGQTLARLAVDMRIGVVTIPMFPARQALVDACGDGVWFAPELYGRTTSDPAVIQSWWDLWVELVGPARCIPAIAGWVASPWHANAESYRSYLDALPPAAGVLVWDGRGSPPRHILEALREYQPGGSSVGTAVLAVRDLLARPAGVALIVAGAIAVTILVIVGAALAQRVASS